MTTTIRDHENDTIADALIGTSKLPRATITVDPIDSPEDTAHAAVIEITEYLGWHAQNYPEHMALLCEQGPEPLNQRWLTDEAIRAIRETISAELGRPVTIEFLGGDTPHITFMLEASTPQGFDTPVHDLRDQAYDLAATVENATTPGTSGHLYLMTEAVARIGLTEDLYNSLLADEG